MFQQKILSAENNYSALSEYLSTLNIKKILLVHGKSFYRLPIANFFLSLKIPSVHFTDFAPNPIYESVTAGVDFYRKNNCDALIAVGGGSAIDVAKCIKLFANMNGGVDYLQQKIIPNKIPLIAVPTTAGTGSESTHFAVIYRAGKKFSVADKSALPSALMLDSSAIKFLPAYQKKVGMLDAFCHALEASWSVNSSEKSRAYAFEAIRLICANWKFYLSENSSETCCAYMLYASRLAGMAINLAKTTAGHALSYKLTSKFGIAHGHAAALCVVEVWKHMQENLNCAVNNNLSEIFQQLAESMNCATVDEAINYFKKILADLNLNKPLQENFSESDIEDLAASVNVERLANNPVRLDEVAIKNIYRQILKGVNFES